MTTLITAAKETGKKFDYFQIRATNTQHVATRGNRVTKRTQHVTLNNVAMCYVDMLRSFGRNFHM